MYTSSQIGINEITNLYLYGNIAKPKDITSAALIRPAGAAGKISIEMDAVSFMASGAGRFSNASTIPVVKAFMDGGVFAANGTRQVFSLAQAVSLVGAKSANIDIAQSNYQDSTNDHAMRTYVYQSSPFTLAQGATFVIEADGKRHIQDLAILPFNDNFDFISNNPLSTFGNIYLKPQVDPTDIGRTVDIIFNQVSKTQVPRIDYTSGIYAADGLRQQQSFTPISGTAQLSTEMPQVINDLWTQGATQILDANGRLVIHGTDLADDKLSQFRFDYDVYDSLYVGARTAINQKGVALIGGSGSDQLYGANRDDYLDGGKDNDRLSGGAGTDTYVFKSGGGNDTIIDSDGLGQINVGGNLLTGAAVTDYKLQGNLGVWTVNSGATVYTLNEAQKQLVITGTSLGAGNSITVTDVNVSKLKGNDGYLGIKLKSTLKTAIVQGSGSNVFATAGFDPTTLAGQASNIVEGLSKTFTVFFSEAAKANSTATLALAAGIADKFKSVLGDRTVDANGAVITLAQGQTQVSFALLQVGDVSADLNGAISVSYLDAGADPSTQSVSNSWGLGIQNNPDPGVPTLTLQGDHQFLDLQGNPSNSPSTLDATLNFATSAAPLEGAQDVLFGSAANEQIEGLRGNDLLSGMQGDDVLLGGDGSDIINGGLGADNISGGDGDDIISGSGAGIAFTQDSLGGYEGLSWPTFAQPDQDYLLGSGLGSVAAEGSHWALRTALSEQGRIESWQLRSDLRCVTAQAAGT